MKTCEIILDVIASISVAKRLAEDIDLHGPANKKL